MAIKRFQLYIMIVAIIFSTPLFLFAQEGNDIVAVVNGIQLKEADLNQEFRKLLPENRNFHGNLSAEKTEKLRAEALQKLIDAELQYQDALARGIKLGEDEYKAQIQKISSNFPDKEQFEAAVAASGFDQKSFARFVERSLLSERLRIAEVDDKALVSDAMVKNYYEQNASRYKKPEEYRASQILIKVDPSANNEERATARVKTEAILKKLKDKKDFADIAAQESDDLTRIKGGDIGYFHAGQTIEEFDAAIAKMKVGEISDIIETIYGFHLIKLTEKRAPRQIPFDEVSNKIKMKLVADEKKRLAELWMSDLRKKAIITYPGKK